MGIPLTLRQLSLSRRMMDKYFWSPSSELKIDEYVKKSDSVKGAITDHLQFRPSIITDDITPWIWVQGSDDKKEDPEQDRAQLGTLAEAHRIINGLVKRLQEIEEDDGIPSRAKKGQKSKKAVRDEVQEGAKLSLKNLSLASKWTVGKWLLFPKHDNVDSLWSTLAQSVAAGPLKEAGVFLAKVAPTPASTEGDDQFVTHLICLYMENVYDLALVRKVLITLLSSHGVEPSAVKSDLYTLAGIDSNHPSKLRSSLWRPHEVIEGGDEAIKALKDEYYKNRSKQGSTAKAPVKMGKDGFLDSDSEDERLVRENKRKAVSKAAETGGGKKEPKTLVKEEEAGDLPRSKGKLEVKKGTGNSKYTTAAIKYKEDDIFGGDDSDSP